ncbi:MAG: V-type ATP synthase subunit E [Phycisphaerae bacterium]|nr:V-type ATP synthase subunit E [Phycisphaerae bacterium]
MNAEQVVKKILAEANAKAEKIVHDAKAKAAEQMSQLENEMTDFDAETGRLAEAAAEDKLQRMLANARMANAKQTLAAKGAILDEVFEKANAAVNKLPDDQYLSLMTTLLKKAVETGDEEVIVGKNESRINERFITQMNRQLNSGFKRNLRLGSRRADITGGFILSRGKVQINASTDVLIESLRERMEIELSQELFA